MKCNLIIGTKEMKVLKVLKKPLRNVEVCELIYSQNDINSIEKNKHRNNISRILKRLLKKNLIEKIEGEGYENKKYKIKPETIKLLRISNARF